VVTIIEHGSYIQIGVEEAGVELSLLSNFPFEDPKRNSNNKNLKT